MSAPEVNVPPPPSAVEVTRRDVDLVYAAALRRCGEPHLAEEVTGAVFVAFARRRGQALRSAERTGSLAAWLLTATRHVTANARRRERRRAYHERRAAASVAAVASADPAVALAWREVAPMVDDAVLSLGRADRTAIVLRFYEDRSSAEIGAALGCSPAAARQRVARALDKLRHKLARRGVEVPPAALAAALSAHLVAAAPPGLVASCVALAAGSTASAAALSLATGGTVLTPLLAKSAAAVVVVAGAVGLGLATAAPHGSPAARPSTTPVNPPPTAPATSPAVAAAGAIDAANLPPSGEVIERVLVPSQRGAHEIDFDTGRTFGPEDYDEISGSAFQGIDAVLGRSPLTPGVRGLGLVVRPVVGAAWNLPPAAREVGTLWERPAAGGEGEWMDAIGDLPRTYLFRTDEGAAGVLQILERLDGEEGEPVGVKLRYRILVRGEGRSLIEQTRAGEEPSERGAVSEAQAELGVRIRSALQMMLIYTFEHGDRWPADLGAAREAAGDAWPADLPDTLVYVPPRRDPAFPTAGERGVLFEARRLPEPTPQNSAPAVVVGFDDGSSRLVHSQKELDDLLTRAGAAAGEGGP